MAALIGLTSACEPNFDPDWHAPQPLDLPDGAADRPVPPPWLVDAGQDAGALPDSAVLVDATVDADAVDADAALEAGSIIVLAPNCTPANNCVDAGPGCLPLCLAPCAEVPCVQGELCRTIGTCSTNCNICAAPPIK